MRHIGQIEQFIGAFIEQRLKPRCRPDAHMMVTARAHFLQIFQIAMENHFAAFLARLPQIIRRVIMLAKHAWEARTDEIFNPIHSLLP